MAFGDVLGTSGNNSGSIPASFSPSAAITVAVGDLAIVVVGERGDLSCTGVSDNLGNVWHPLNQADFGNPTVIAFWSIITSAGSMTPTAACTSSGNDAGISCVVYEGPFNTDGPLDLNGIVKSNSGTTTPSANATGTLGQADELIVAYWSASNGVTSSSPTPTGARLDREDRSGTGANTMSSAISSLVVSATTSVTMGLTTSSGGGIPAGVATFRKSGGSVPFGARLNSSFGHGTSIPNPATPFSALTVKVGDLVVVALSEQTTQSATTCSDNLGNSWTALTAGDQGSSTVKAWYSIITTAGQCTPSVATTAGGNNYSIVAVAYQGPFASSPLDQNPACAAGAASTTQSSPSTGTLSQADELVLAYWGSGNSGVYITALDAGVLDGNARDLGGVSTASITSKVVAATTSTSFTATVQAASAEEIGIASFKKGDLNLSPSLYTNTQTFHAATVTPGAVNLAPSLFTNTQTFFSPAVTQGSDQDLQPSLFTNTQSFFTPTVAAFYELTPALFTNTQSFFDPTVLATYSLEPSLYTNGQSFFSPSVSSTYDLAPSLFTNTQTFFSPTVLATYELFPALFSNEQTFVLGDPYFFLPDEVTQTAATQDLQPSLYTNSQTFFNPSVTATYDLAPALFTNTQTFFSATVLSTYDIAPSLYTNSQSFFDPTVLSTYDLQPALFVNSQTFFSATVSSTRDIAPDLFTNTQTFFTEIVSAGELFLLPPLLTNTQSFFDATVVQIGGGVAERNNPFIASTGVLTTR